MSRMSMMRHRAIAVPLGAVSSERPSVISEALHPGRMVGAAAVFSGEA
jgi:hypothetical protein